LDGRRDRRTQRSTDARSAGQITEAYEEQLLAAGRLVLLYLPTYSRWLNPIEMLWRHFRREVTHCELFATKQALLVAAQDCFNRFNQRPEKNLSVIGSNAQKVS
jgi:transposase